jgi:hypothetical protein
MVAISFFIILMSCIVQIDASGHYFHESIQKNEAPEPLIEHTKEFEKQSIEFKHMIHSLIFILQL